VKTGTYRNDEGYVYIIPRSNPRLAFTSPGWSPLCLIEQPNRAAGARIVAGRIASPTRLTLTSVGVFVSIAD
jgi:hypothetical protein